MKELNLFCFLYVNSLFNLPTNGMDDCVDLISHKSPELSQKTLPILTRCVEDVIFIFLHTPPPNH